MENKEKNIDDLFRDALGDYAETPPRAAWNRLEQTLEGRKTTDPGKPYRKLGYFAFAALLMLLGFSVVRNIAGSSFQSPKNVASNEKSVAGAPGGESGSTVKNGNITAATGNELTASSNENKTSDNFNDRKNDRTGENNETINKNKSSHSIAGNDKTAQKNRTSSANKKNAPGKYSFAKTTKSKTSGKGKNAGRTENDGDDNDNTGNSNESKAVAAKKTPLQAQAPADKDKPKEVAMAPTKTTLPKPKASLADNNDAKRKMRPVFNRFEAGVKAGYETGFNNDAAKKAVVSPYVQCNISPKWSVMLQPSIKSAFLSSRIIGTPQSYYKVNNDGKITGPDSFLTPIIADGIVDSLWKRNYTYSQTHDSIVKISSIGGTYMEFELPVLIKYKISKSLSVYGGVNIIYSKLISVTENTTTSQPILKSVPKYTFGEYHAAAPAIPQFDSVITYTGTPISSYTGPQYPATNGSQLRCGYMLGFSYEYSKRWLFDALVQQGTVSPNVQAGYNINAALSAAYLRLTLGYKLTK